MAVREISGIKHYVGLSTDDKPTTAPAGSVLWVIDQNAGSLSRWVYSGQTWAEEQDDQADRLAAIADKLDSISGILMQILELHAALVTANQ